MKIAIFDTHRFERKYLEAAAKEYSFELTYFEVRLTEDTARLASGFSVICCFVNDCLNSTVLTSLHDLGVKLVALRSAGFNRVDLATAHQLDLKIVRVPEYSPYAVAEHAVAMILSLNRKIPQAHARVRDSNFTLDGLVGFDLNGKTVGIIGTGKIGLVFAKIMNGFGCRILAYDPIPNQKLQEKIDIRYVALPELFQNSDIISLHAPLTPHTRHMINKEAFGQMKKGVMLINTGRGALIETQALIAGLKSGQIGFAGLDVYEEEENVFFHDLSGQVLEDDLLARLLTFPNVLITSHQAFLTQEALRNIAVTTFKNVHEFEQNLPLTHEVMQS